MMNWIKNIFLTGVLIIVSTFFKNSNAQGEQHIGPTKYNKWIQVSRSDCGKGSFYIYVNKSFDRNDMLYYFDVYIWSDSYYKDCSVSHTYIDNVVIFVENFGKYDRSLSLDYYLAAPKSNSFNGWNHMAFIYSAKSSQEFKIKWDLISTY
jgi:hypothetical protein